MEVSEVHHALSLAKVGASVLYVCESHHEIPEVFQAAQGAEGAIALLCARGRERICFESGGRVIIRTMRQGDSVRGFTFDAVFAPATMWWDVESRANLMQTTLGSNFFAPDWPLTFSTFQRVGGWQC